MTKATNLEGGDTIVQRAGNDAGPGAGTAPRDEGTGATTDGPADGGVAGSASTSAAGETSTGEGTGASTEGLPTATDDVASGVTDDEPSEVTDDATQQVPSDATDDVSGDTADDAVSDEPSPDSSSGGPDDEEADELEPPNEMVVDGPELEPETEGSGPSPDTDAGSDDEPLADVGVPAGAHCEAVADWDPAWVAFEAQVLSLVNEARAAGEPCDEGSVGEVAPALLADPTLTCAARLHSLDMYERDFYGHEAPLADAGSQGDEEAPAGIGPAERIQAAGYSFQQMGENIALAFETPEAVIASWLAVPEYCTNIMDPRFTVLGVGYYPGQAPGYEHLWTQNFAAPRSGF